MLKWHETPHNQSINNTKLKHFFSMTDNALNCALEMYLYGLSHLRLGHTGKRVCYGRKTDKTCRIWLSGDKIHLL